MGSNYEHRDNSGSAFPNDRKRSDRDPGYTGSAKIDGQDYWVSVWVNDDTRNPGKKRLSFSFNPKTPQRATTPADDTADDDIPF